MYDAGINYPQQTVRVHCRRRRSRPLYLDDAYAEVEAYVNRTWRGILLTTKSNSRNDEISLVK